MQTIIIALLRGELSKTPATPRFVLVMLAVLAGVNELIYTYYGWHVELYSLLAAVLIVWFFPIKEEEGEEDARFDDLGPDSLAPSVDQHDVADLDDLDDRAVPDSSGDQTS